MFQTVLTQDMDFFDRPENSSGDLDVEIVVLPIRIARADQSQHTSYLHSLHQDHLVKHPSHRVRLGARSCGGL